MEGKEGAQLLIEFLQGKGANLLFWMAVIAIILFLLKKVPLIGAGLHSFIVGAGKDVAALGGKGLAWVLTHLFNFAVNFIASAAMFLIWAIECGLLYGEYLVRLWIARSKEVREPQKPAYPAAHGWIKLLPTKKSSRSGGNHH